MPWDNEIWAPCRLGEKFEYIDLGNRRNGWLLSVSADWMGGRGDHCAVNQQKDLLKPHGGYNVKIGLGPRPWSKCWTFEPKTGIRERMDKCTCSACGAVRYEWRGEYENRTMTGCDACGAHCMAVRKRNGKLPYEADGSLLWFHRHKDTAVAQGYEVNYWVGKTSCGAMH